MYGITDRIRFSVIEANSNIIVCNDLVVKEPQVTVNLSAPSRSTFKIPMSEQFYSSSGIEWKAWGYWIIPELEINGVRKCLGAQIVNKCDIDPQSGDLTVEALGFMGYPKGIPWLADYNPIAVDPAEVIQKVWADCQNYTNANLGVEVLPASTGTQMLPGYSFDGNVLSFDFFAMFIRSVDFQDSGDVINSIARDTPLDLLEEVEWNQDRTSVNKVLRLGYPYLGFVQQALAFVVGENVISAECADELEIEPVSDIIIRSWLPGKTYSSQLNLETFSEENGYELADPQKRFRRVMMEEDAHIDSVERAKAWAKRRLTRRNIPKSFGKITVDWNHPNAPVGSFWVGDTVYVEGKNYPWKGDIAAWHRVTSMTFKDDATLGEIGLKVDGAFNYDPIEYNPEYDTQPTADPNKLTNGYFDISFRGWKQTAGQWIYTKQDGYTNFGCGYVICDDAEETLESHKISVDPGVQLDISGWTKRRDIIKKSNFDNNTDGIYITVKFYKNGALMSSSRLAALNSVDGTGPWTKVSGIVTVPVDGTVNEISVVLSASGLDGGYMWWDDVRVLPV